MGIEVLENITAFTAVTVVPGFSKGASTGTGCTRAKHKANSKAGALLTKLTETSVGLAGSTSVFSRR